MVLSPRVPFMCACARDCNSNTVAQNYGPGYRGCDPHVCCEYEDGRCGRPGSGLPPYANHACSYPPSRLGEALYAQYRLYAGHARTHNEIVVDPLGVQLLLPGAISAFFYMSTSLESAQVARRMRNNFLSAFPQLSARDVPLVSLDLDARLPFSMVA